MKVQVLLAALVLNVIESATREYLVDCSCYRRHRVLDCHCRFSLLESDSLVQLQPHSAEQHCSRLSAVVLKTRLIFITALLSNMVFLATVNTNPNCPPVVPHLLGHTWCWGRSTVTTFNYQQSLPRFHTLPCSTLTSEDAIASGGKATECSGALYGKICEAPCLQTLRRVASTAAGTYGQRPLCCYP